MAVVAISMIGGLGARDARAGESSALSTEPIPMKTEDELPGRTPPIIEIGPSFLGKGNIPGGIELPTGAVWTPALWVFGDLRTAINYVDNGDDPDVLEWANRLDLFANLQLSGTERILFGIQPLHDHGEFSGHIWKPDDRDGTRDRLNADVTTLFFEGEFGEIFPELDPEDTGSFDYGFAVGRQLIFFQEGMMFNDTIDSVGITRDTVFIPNASVDTRITALFGWSEIDRDNNTEDNDALVFGLFTETDFRATTTNLDVAYVTSNDAFGGDGLYVGASATQRFGHWNTSFRGNASISLEEESAAVSTGGLLFAEVSTTPARTDNVAYGNAFWAIDEFASAARDETAGGPLGRVGLLFAAVGLGNYAAPLSNRADKVLGASLGYQWFFNDHRTQIVLEVGGRKGTSSEIDDAAAIGTRFQQAIGTRLIFRIDGFAAARENRDEGVGIRSEVLVRF
ncbi:MAG: hypothetical protein ACE5H8_12270 [Alphaproteobacteria bacterium]